MLRLHSVISSGFGKETGLISFLYSHLLNISRLDFCDLIIVNHIGLELEEKIFYDKGKIHINIRYPVDDAFLYKSAREKNVVFLDIIHNALLRLAIEDARMEPIKLEKIRQEILDKDFLFEVEYMVVPSETDKNLVAQILLHPHTDKFDFFARIVYKEQIKWEALIYEGGPSSYYFDDLFYNGKWKGDREFVVGGRRSEIEFHFNADDGRITLINTSEDKSKAPVFSLFRINAGSQELQDYINSLPPAVAAIITCQPN
jgi:hypothetical protein